MLDPLSSPKPKSLHNFCQIITRYSKRVILRCLAQRTTKELLRLVSHHTPTHCHVFREFLQQILCQFTGTNSQHVVHMHTNANFQFNVRKQTRIALILNETPAQLAQLARSGGRTRSGPGQGRRTGPTGRQRNVCGKAPESPRRRGSTNWRALSRLLRSPRLRSKL